MLGLRSSFPAREGFISFFENSHECCLSNYSSVENEILVLGIYEHGNYVLALVTLRMRSNASWFLGLFIRAFSSFSCVLFSIVLVAFLS